MVKVKINCSGLLRTKNDKYGALYLLWVHVYNAAFSCSRIFPFLLELKITIQFSKVEKVLPNVLNSPLDEEKQEQIVPEKSARLNLGTEILDF